MSSSNASLVRYDNPLLVSTIKDASRRGRGRGGQARGDNLTPTEDILNSILPPREWTDNGQLWVQYVSSTPATASEVIALQEKLDHRLQQRQARETGICPIREELYAQCFDELIRQTAINCAERGLLLLRVRDEIRMSIASYQTLYESSVAFGMRKALLAEQKKAELEEELKLLEDEISGLQHSVQETQQRTNLVQDTDSKRSSEELSKHEEELQMLKEHHDKLRSDLEEALSVPTHDEIQAADSTQPEAVSVQ
jgi:dynein axonemal light intermediate chain 1